jgi:hypothetical protein
MFTIRYSLLVNICSLFTIHCFSQGVSVNTTGTAADNSAILDVSSSSQGLLIPRMTTVQRDAIVSPALSLLIFNITTNCYEAYVNGIWYSISCAPCNQPSPPLAGTNIPDYTQIVWNWNPVNGATGYKWNTVNDYASATDNGTSTTLTQTCFDCGKIYSIYVWAYNSCGISTATELTQSTTACLSGCPQMQMTVGGTGDDYGYYVQQTGDGGYIMTGVTTSYGAGGQDFYLVKIDTDGNLSWSRTYGGINSDAAFFVQQTGDGGYIMAGTSYSFGAGACDILLVRTDASGNLLWSKSFGGASEDYCRSAQITSDGGFVILSASRSFGAGDYDAYLIRTDGSGNILWNKTYGSIGFDDAQYVQQTSDGGYIIAATSEKFGAGEQDVYLIRTDGNGNVLWSKTIGGTGIDIPYYIGQTDDGGYIVSGATMSYGAGDFDVYFIRIDGSGNVLWNKSYGGTGRESAHSVHQTCEGGYFLAGLTSSFGAGWYDHYYIRTDGSGNFIESKTYGGIEYEHNYEAKKSIDGGYYMLGITKSFGAGAFDFYLVTTDSKGNGGGCNTDTSVPFVTSPNSIVTSPVTIVNIPATIVSNASLTVTSPTPTVTTLCFKCK